MKRTVIGALFMLFFYIGFGQNRWKKEGIKIPPTVCYAVDESHPSHTGPPREYYERLKSASIKQAIIEVTYNGFSDEAQQAFQYAVDIWESLIYSPVTIRIQANWVSLDQGVLGNCGPTSFYKNFNSTQKWECYYPVVLVEKMLGQEVNGVEQYDMEASFNKDFSNWYFGTDFNTPDQKYDFVSTVLHELTHGLGFSGIMYSSNGRGGYSYGSDLLPAIFDRFVIDKSGKNLVNKSLYTNPSVKLNLALTSGWLDFNTKLVEGQLPRLYAPSTWDDGSSLYHLDDVTYPFGDTNSLMTPFAAKGEAIHNPGPNTLAIMYDMGWKSISIKHKQLKDIEFSTAPIEFIAEIESDYDLDSSKVYLVYSSNKFTKTDSVLLNTTDGATYFSARLSSIKNGEFDYFFTATDIKNRRFVFPSNAPQRFMSFKIGIDKEAPLVLHEPIKYMLPTNLSIEINAEVTDNLGVKSVKLDYFVNGGMLEEILLLNDSADNFTGNLVFPAGSLKDGDIISYRIVATDASSQSNIGRSPLSGYFSFYVQSIQKPVDKYVNDFNTETNDFISDDFSVYTADGFDSQALNSPHPYLSPNTDNMNFNFTSVLKYPIILKSGGKMNFDEIVIVEPGETGSKFGSEEFFDYVIAEGSKDGGNTWKPLADGYDCNAQKSWVDLYNSSISGDNSTAIPAKDLFVKRDIDLLANGNFSAGDTIQIRFRLFSDPYANGWGWIIDNLKIQDIGTSVNSMDLSPGEVVFFPNPVTDQLNVQIQAKNTIGKLNIKAYNSLGKLVYNQQLGVGSNSFESQIDLRNYSPGLYIFTIEPNNGPSIKRKIIVR